MRGLHGLYAHSKPRSIKKEGGERSADCSSLFCFPPLSRYEHVDIFGYLNIAICSYRHIVMTGNGQFVSLCFAAISQYDDIEISTYVDTVISSPRRELRMGEQMVWCVWA